jgi:predicted unusual protein kinase regulating ubiquinone biosynthesis (AarF/ABC1/UbiB family)
VNEPVGLVAAATDRSEGGDRAVAWAASYARSLRSDLAVIQVMAPATDGDGHPGAQAAWQADLEAALADHEPRPRAIVAEGEDIAATIVERARDAGAETIVIGSSGMRGRKEFLLGNVANRVTHLANCTVVVVNTFAGEAAEADGAASGLRGRAQEIAVVLGPVAARQLAGRVMRSDGDPEAPRHLREALERLGPTFGKLGQILSTRPDLLSEDYIAELASLQSDVPPMPEEEVVAAMERELCVPWEDVFSFIEPEPLAAGTIGQVHRARLADGHPVVVKVQRPNAAQRVEQDLELLAAAIKPATRSRHIRRIVDLSSIFEQMSGALRNELDFLEEARNIERMGEIVGSGRRVAVPLCHRELTTRGLLVMDEVVGGVPLAEAPDCPERTEAVRELLRVFYKQVLHEGFFHADPHPGNMLWAENTIWMIDLGMVGHLDAKTRQALVLVLLALGQGDVEMLVDVSLDLSEIAGDVDLDVAAYRRDLAAVVDGVRGRSLQEIRLIELLNQLTVISIHHGVPLPSSIALVAKALSQVELTVCELAPELNPVDEAGRYLLRSIAGRVAGRLDPQQLFYEAERMRYRLGQIGEGIATVAGNRPGHQLEMRFTSRSLEQKVAWAGRTTALGFGSGLTWVAAAIVSTSDKPDPRLVKGLRVLAGGLSAGLIASVARRR